jgi:glycosyltransferase involved in cell wall biosynthesis
VHVVHNGIPLVEGNPRPVREELGVRAGELLILAVGNLDERKGHLILLRALALLGHQGLSQPWRLAIAGGRGGPERPKLEAFAREHGMQDRLHILSHRDDIANLQAAADIFAMPSLWEGLPLALLEAMLAGKAIVASDTAGIPEAIAPESHGLLVAPGNPELLAEALHRLLTEASLRKRLGSAALERGRREFTIGAMADSYEPYYRAT